jgi:MmgE/PrpD C-terminal domain
MAELLGREAGYSRGRGGSMHVAIPSIGLLAQSGQHGAAHWYEGPAGFARAFADDSEPDLSDWELGRRWRLLNVTYKPYPVCAITQSEVQVAIDLATEHDLDPAQIGSVRVYLNPQDRTYPGTLNKGPFNDVGASLMSAEYCVAMALKHRTATLAGLREFEDETIHRLVSVTEVLPDDELPALGGGVEVELVSGETHSGRLVPTDATYGWDWQGVLANVRRLEPELAVGRATLDGLEQAVRELTALESVERLFKGTLP